MDNTFVFELNTFLLVTLTPLKPGVYIERKSTPYTQTIVRTWGAYSRPPRPTYTVVTAHRPIINTPTIRRLYAWMLDCHWLIARDLCVYAGFYATYNINPSPWNGTQAAVAFIPCINHICLGIRAEIRMEYKRHYARICVDSFAHFSLRTTRTECKPGFRKCLQHNGWPL